MHGDFVQLDVLGPDGVPSSHIQVALCEQEAADSQRFIYHPSPSPSPEPTTPIEEGEGPRAEGTTTVEDEHSDRASRMSGRRRRGESDENFERSASVSLLQRHVSYKLAPERSPLLDVTNTDLDRHVLGPLPESTSKIGPHSIVTVKKPHVDDLWCATDTVQPIGSPFLRNESLQDPLVDSLDAFDSPPGTGPRQTLNLSRALFPEDAEVVRVTAPPGESLVPTLLEVVGELDQEAIKEELQRWGHSTAKVLLLNRTHGGVPVAVADVEPTRNCFFVLLWEDATDTFLWHETSTLPSTWNELDLMRLLGRLGKPRSVVIATLQLSTRIRVIQFEDVAQAQKQLEQVRWYVADLPRSESSGTSEAFSEQLHRNVREPPDDSCTLRPGCTLDVVAQLFDTHDFLQTSLDGLELPPQCRELY